METDDEYVEIESPLTRHHLVARAVVFGKGVTSVVIDSDDAIGDHELLEIARLTPNATTMIVGNDNELDVLATDEPNTVTEAGMRKLAKLCPKLKEIDNHLGIDMLRYIRIYSRGVRTASRVIILITA